VLALAILLFLNYISMADEPEKRFDSNVNLSGFDLLNIGGIASLQKVMPPTVSESNRLVAFSDLAGVGVKAIGAGSGANFVYGYPNEAYSRLSLFTQVVRNVGGGYDAINSRYISPVTGIFGVSGLIEFYPALNNTAVVFALIAYVNGVERQHLTIQGAPTNGTYYAGSGYAEIEVNKDDYIELWTWHNGGEGSRFVVSASRTVFNCRLLN
jgi:hypothetical protein